MTVYATVSMVHTAEALLLDSLQEIGFDMTKCVAHYRAAKSIPSAPRDVMWLL